MHGNAGGFTPSRRFRPRRSLGQNFLVDDRAIGIIVRAFGPRPGDRVLEIGPGQGALTRQVAGRVERLLAVEVDPELAAGLRATLVPALPAGRLEILEADVLAVPAGDLLARLGAGPDRPARLLANLPYNIATTVIVALLPAFPVLADMMVMVQQEVAERIASPPGSKEYGSLSILCQTYAKVEPVLRLGPGSFRPRPKVSSEVLHLVLRDPGGAAGRERDRFARFVRAAFTARRKTLHNNLAALAGTDRPRLGPDGARRLTAAAGIDGRQRPEDLPPAAYEALFAAWRVTSSPPRGNGAPPV